MTYWRKSSKVSRLFKTGNIAVAEISFEEVLKVDPRSATAYCNLGVVYARTDRLDAAIGAFEQAQELTPNVPGINLNLGLIFYRKEQFAKAAEEFDRALRLDLPLQGPDRFFTFPEVSGDSTWVEGKPIRLFNGKNLHGWTGIDSDKAEGWTVERGVLKNTGQTDDLITLAKFWNYELHAEYRLARRATAASGCAVAMKFKFCPIREGLRVCMALVRYTRAFCRV